MPEPFSAISAGHEMFGLPGSRRVDSNPYRTIVEPLFTLLDEVSEKHSPVTVNPSCRYFKDVTCLLRIEVLALYSLLVRLAC